MTIRRYFNSGLYVLPILLFLFTFSQAMAADVSLAWDASISPDITQYNVYIGNTSGVYGTPITIGNQTTYTVTGLTSGTYYFAVTALDADGNESDFSNEVSQIVGSSASKCDLNGDGSVNALDLQLLANAILGLSPTSASYDLNGDGAVNVLDLQFLANVILGLTSCQ
jgi:hypothetical protein